MTKSMTTPKVTFWWRVKHMFGRRKLKNVKPATSTTPETLTTIVLPGTPDLFPLEETLGLDRLIPARVDLLSHLNIELIQYSRNPFTIRSRMESPDGGCRLLQLPRELRDMIWEFALMDNRGLYTLNYCHRLYTLDFKDINQLKYVNWQLYYETRGLAVRLNEIHFIQRCKDSPCPVTKFFLFIRHCSPKNRAGIHVVLQGNWHDWVTGILPHLVEYCRRHPKSSIGIRHPQWRIDYQRPQDLFKLLSLGHHFQRALRGTTDLRDFGGVDWGKKGWILGGLGPEYLNLPNLRILPGDDKFDDKMFWNTVMKYKGSIGIPTREKLADYVADAHRLFEMGV
ncbi:hypothetical protein K505DRAFT_376606 [Melanomma pulvis-pyrius CBS 109.77]|uniref:Uncharacterized protein n=1 Tax=Melanomma pulvis-pyrius CBS 109.77 TaxID=1314802 RepID=A0A6A6X5L9_9PLEO|nr:hypothetical protein K505DRAFT_376606 [Melanomma pulvis-pyrius CBS 109.77]